MKLRLAPFLFSKMDENVGESPRTEPLLDPQSKKTSSKYNIPESSNAYGTKGLLENVHFSCCDFFNILNCYFLCEGCCIFCVI